MKINKYVENRDLNLLSQSLLESGSNLILQNLTSSGRHDLKTIQQVAKKHFTDGTLSAAERTHLYVNLRAAATGKCEFYDHSVVWTIARFFAWLFNIPLQGDQLIRDIPLFKHILMNELKQDCATFQTTSLLPKYTHLRSELEFMVEVVKATFHEETNLAVQTQILKNLEFLKVKTSDRKAATKLQDSYKELYQQYQQNVAATTTPLDRPKKKVQVADLRAFYDRGKKDVNCYDEQTLSGFAIHSGFKKDCDRNKDAYFIENESFKHIFRRLQSQNPTLSISDFQQTLADYLAATLETKGMGKLVTAVSTAFNQKSLLDLNNELREFCLAEFNGLLVGDQAKNTIQLDFPKDGGVRLQAKITGSFNQLMMTNGNYIQTLERPCEYEAKLTIHIALDGTAKMESQISLPTKISFSKQPFLLMPNIDASFRANTRSGNSLDAILKQLLSIDYLSLKSSEKRTLFLNLQAAYEGKKECDQTKKSIKENHETEPTLADLPIFQQFVKEDLLINDWIAPSKIEKLPNTPLVNFILAGGDWKLVLDTARTAFLAQQRADILANNTDASLQMRMLSNLSLVIEARKEYLAQEKKPQSELDAVAAYYTDFKVKLMAESV